MVLSFAHRLIALRPKGGQAVANLEALANAATLKHFGLLRPIGFDVLLELGGQSFETGDLLSAENRTTTRSEITLRVS